MVSPVYQVRTIAIPPPKGVGEECKLLSLGISKISLFNAILRIIIVRRKDASPRKRIKNMASGNFKLQIEFKRLLIIKY